MPQLIFILILSSLNALATQKLCLMALSGAEKEEILRRVSDLRRMREIEEMLGELVLETESGDEYLAYQFNLKQTLVAELERLEEKYGDAHRDSPWTRRMKARLQRVSDENFRDWESNAERRSTERYIEEKKEQLAELKPQVDRLEEEALKIEKMRAHLMDMNRNFIDEGLTPPAWFNALYYNSLLPTKIEKQYKEVRREYEAILIDVREHEDSLREQDQMPSRKSS